MAKKKGGMKGMSIKSGDKRPTKSGAGMTAKGVAKYRRQNPGSKLKTAVTEKNATGARAKRRKSYCARSESAAPRLRTRGSAKPEGVGDAERKNMRTLIDFFKDESGLEAIEFLTAAVPVTGGAAVAFVALREDLTAKSTTLIETIAVDP